MVTFYAKDHQIYTEDEARGQALEMIECNNLHIDALKELSYAVIWEMLKDCEKEEIIENLISEILDEEFDSRTF